MINFQLLWADTKRNLLQSELSHQYSWKKWFLWAITAEQTSVNQEDCGFTWYYQEGKKTFMSTLTQDETSAAQQEG